MTDELDDPKVQAMFREVGICSQMIGAGLTNIRKADFVTHWKFGSAFFELTIGVERFCKLIIVRRYQRLNNGAFPDNSYVRRFSHSIEDLIREVTKECDSECIGKNDIVDQIIIFLSEFAKESRYYNLDSLTKNLPKEKDPLRIWKSIQNAILKLHDKKREYSPGEKKIIGALDEIAIFRYRDLDGTGINNAVDFYEVGKAVDLIQSYSVYYIYLLIKDIVSVMQTENDLYYAMPVMTEFFPYFYDGALEKKHILKKKRWNYY
jgi:hypothetical protein